VARRVVLHVGTMKSGTTYVQASLFAQRERLARAGVLVPGKKWGHQVSAVRQILGRRAARPAWQTLVEQVAAHPGDAVVSMEFLGPANEQAARRVVEGLAPAEVEVVVTARDLNRTLPSMWQETIQNGRTWSWEDYLADARRLAPGRDRGHADRKTAGGTFWRQQHLARIVTDWSRLVGRDRVRLVTLPPPGADPAELGRRFVEASGLPLDPTLPVPSSNESLGLASALVLRRVNEELTAQGLDFPQGQRLRKHVLAKTSLVHLARQEPRLGLPVADWVTEQTDATRATLRADGVQLVGDWADLDPVPVRGVAPEDVDDATVAHAAVTGLTAVLAHQIRD
jgi:hypothetical protein